jgi:hypothetical protein
MFCTTETWRRDPLYSIRLHYFIDFGLVSLPRHETRVFIKYVFDIFWLFEEGRSSASYLKRPNHFIEL